MAHSNLKTEIIHLLDGQTDDMLLQEIYGLLHNASLDKDFSEKRNSPALVKSIEKGLQDIDNHLTVDWHTFTQQRKTWLSK